MKPLVYDILAMPEPLDLDLPFFLKETQLQHGLRGEDYQRYHMYLTNRVATLRKQTHLSNDKKKFLHKEVTPNTATDIQHLILLLFYAERCCAAAEALQARRQTLAADRASGISREQSACPPAGLFRKRLNKAVKWTEKLVLVADAVASPRLQQQCRAYHLEVLGRCQSCHREEAKAKTSFLASRHIYFQLLSQCDTEKSELVLRQKLSELDDRIGYCMQMLGEDPLSYKPDTGRDTVSEALQSTQLEWNGKPLVVLSIKVKDALREADAIPVQEMQRKVLDSGAGTAIPVGQVSRVLDMYDRRVGYCNDGLNHARQDLRAAGSKKTELQLIVHYFHFRVAEEVLMRKFFMADVYARRFEATEQVVRGTAQTKRGEASHATPLEVVRIFETALETVEEMELLPGVAGRSDAETYSAICQAGKFFYSGESWRVVGELHKARKHYYSAVSCLEEVHSRHPAAQRLYNMAQSSALRVEALSTLSSSLRETSVEDSVQFLSECTESSVTVAANVIPFPPMYQAAPAKPVFVDIASTYVDFSDYLNEEEEPATGAAQPAAPAPSSKQVEKGAEPGKRWGFKWGWGQKQ